MQVFMEVIDVDEEEDGAPNRFREGYQRLLVTNCLPLSTVPFGCGMKNVIHAFVFPVIPLYLSLCLSRLRDKSFCKVHYDNVCCCCWCGVMCIYVCGVSQDLEDLKPCSGHYAVVLQMCHCDACCNVFHEFTFDADQ